MYIIQTQPGAFQISAVQRTNISTNALHRFVYSHVLCSVFKGRKMNHSCLCMSLRSLAIIARFINFHGFLFTRILFNYQTLAVGSSGSLRFGLLSNRRQAPLDNLQGSIAAASLGAPNPELFFQRFVVLGLDVALVIFFGSVFSPVQICLLQSVENKRYIYPNLPKRAFIPCYAMTLSHVQSFDHLINRAIISHYQTTLHRTTISLNRAGFFE